MDVKARYSHELLLNLTIMCSTGVPQIFVKSLSVCSTTKSEMKVSHEYRPVNVLLKRCNTKGNVREAIIVCLSQWLHPK